MKHPPGFLRSFSRSQAASAFATGLDYGVIFLLTERLGVWYVASTAAGAFVGGITNFLLNRHWSFSASHHGVHGQALRYLLISGASLLLNCGGVWAITETWHVPYGISVVLVSVAVGLGFNYPLFRHYVFAR